MRRVASKTGRLAVFKGKLSKSLMETLMIVFCFLGASTAPSLQWTIFSVYREIYAYRWAYYLLESLLKLNF